MTAAVSQELNEEAFPLISIIRKKGISQEGRRGNKIGWGQSASYISLFLLLSAIYQSVLRGDNVPSAC